MRRALYDNVADGRVEIVGERDGEHLFKLNDEGIARAREIIDRYIDGHDDPAAALALALDVPLGVADGLIAHRREERGDAV